MLEIVYRPECFWEIVFLPIPYNPLKVHYRSSVCFHTYLLQLNISTNQTLFFYRFYNNSSI